MIKENQTYYERLGVAPSASSQEIKNAWRERVKEYHPDKNEADTQQSFKLAKEAYETLSDTKERQRYDRLGHDRYQELGEGATGTRRQSSTSGGQASGKSDPGGKGGNAAEDDGFGYGDSWGAGDASEGSSGGPSWAQQSGGQSGTSYDPEETEQTTWSDIGDFGTGVGSKTEGESHEENAGSYGDRKSGEKDQRRQSNRQRSRNHGSTAGGSGRKSESDSWQGQGGPTDRTTGTRNGWRPGSGVRDPPPDPKGVVEEDTGDESGQLNSVARLVIGCACLLLPAIAWLSLWFAVARLPEIGSTGGAVFLLGLVVATVAIVFTITVAVAERAVNWQGRSITK